CGAGDVAIVTFLFSLPLDELHATSIIVKNTNIAKLINFFITFLLNMFFFKMNSYVKKYFLLNKRKYPPSLISESKHYFLRITTISLNDGCWVSSGTSLHHS